MLFLNWTAENLIASHFTILEDLIWNDWLIIYSFTSHFKRIFHLYGDVTITGDGLQNLGRCLTLRAFEQGGIFIIPHLLWHRVSVFPVSSEGPPHSVALMIRKRMWRIYSNPDPHRSPFSCLLRHTRGYGGPILTRILTGRYEMNSWYIFKKSMTFSKNMRSMGNLAHLSHLGPYLKNFHINVHFIPFVVTTFHFKSKWFSWSTHVQKLRSKFEL
jgi:hypothetical protein